MHASKKGPNSRAQQGSAKQAKANRGSMIVQALETIPVADLKKLFFIHKRRISLFFNAKLGHFNISDFFLHVTKHSN